GHNVPGWRHLHGAFCSRIASGPRTQADALMIRCATSAPHLRVADNAVKCELPSGNVRCWAHIDEILRSFACQLLGEDRKWLTCDKNDANDPKRSSIRYSIGLRCLEVISVGHRASNQSQNIQSLARRFCIACHGRVVLMEGEEHEDLEVLLD